MLLRRFPAFRLKQLEPRFVTLQNLSVPHHRQSTTQLLLKIPSVQFLYRHTRFGIYYACKKLRGKRKERGLKTTDRKTAERLLKQWLKDLERVDAVTGQITFAELFLKLTAACEAKSWQTKRAASKRAKTRAKTRRSSTTAKMPKRCSRKACPGFAVEK